jgi:hypothetical protein
MAYGKRLTVSSLMGPKMNARQQRHVGALDNTLGETTGEQRFCGGGSLAQKRLKRPDARVGLRWKGTRKQLPKALLSAAFSQVSKISRRVSVGLHAKAFGYASK